MSLDASEQLVEDDIADDVVNNDMNGPTSGTSGSTSTDGENPRPRNDNRPTNSGENDDDEVADHDKEDEATSSEDGERGKKVCMRDGEKILANEIGICIIEGSGQSNQISLVNDEIVVNNETPKSVCMTAFACRKIVDGKFRVVALKKTGFCKNGSAHSVQLSDQQVKELMDKI